MNMISLYFDKLIKINFSFLSLSVWESLLAVYWLFVQFVELNVGLNHHFRVTRFLRIGLLTYYSGISENVSLRWEDQSI